MRTLEGMVGIEPTTEGLTDLCSTTKLHTQVSQDPNLHTAQPDRLDPDFETSEDRSASVT